MRNGARSLVSYANPFAEPSSSLDNSSIDSDIIHIDAAGQSIVVLNSVEATYDLFEKRSSIYSSRYVMLFLGGLDVNVF